MKHSRKHSLAMKEGDICIIALMLTTSYLYSMTAALLLLLFRSTFTSTFMDLFNDDALLSLFSTEYCAQKCKQLHHVLNKNDKYLKYLLNMLIVEGMKKDKNYKIVTKIFKKRILPCT